MLKVGDEVKYIGIHSNYFHKGKNYTISKIALSTILLIV